VLKHVTIIITSWAIVSDICPFHAGSMRKYILASIRGYLVACRLGLQPTTAGFVYVQVPMFDLIW
jgi:hypothetical protein